MVALSEQGALVNRFQDHQLQIAGGMDLTAYIGTRHSLIDLTEEGNKRGIQVLVGMGDVEEMGGALRGANAVAASLQNQQKEEKERKEAAKRRQLQLLLDELAALGEKIDGLADQIEKYDVKIDALETAMVGISNGTLDLENALSDPHVVDAVADWEARTGKRFDPNAENAADVLVAILAVQRDEYLADRNALVERHNDLVDEYNNKARTMDEIGERYPHEKREASLQTRELAEESHLSAIVVQAEAGEAALVDIGVEVDDAVFEFEQGEVDTEQALSGLPSPNIGLDGMDGVGTFNAAAMPLLNLDDSEFEIAGEPKIGGFDAS